MALQDLIQAAALGANKTSEWGNSISEGFSKGQQIAVQQRKLDIEDEVAKQNLLKIQGDLAQHSLGWAQLSLNPEAKPGDIETYLTKAEEASPGKFTDALKNIKSLNIFLKTKEGQEATENLRRYKVLSDDPTTPPTYKEDGTPISAKEKYSQLFLDFMNKAGTTDAIMVSQQISRLAKQDIDAMKQMKQGTDKEDSLGKARAQQVSKDFFEGYQKFIGSKNISPDTIENINKKYNINLGKVYSNKELLNAMQTGNSAIITPYLSALSELQSTSDNVDKVKQQIEKDKELYKSSPDNKVSRDKFLQLQKEIAKYGINDKNYQKLSQLSDEMVVPLKSTTEKRQRTEKLEDVKFSNIEDSNKKKQEFDKAYTEVITNKKALDEAINSNSQWQIKTQLLRMAQAHGASGRVPVQEMNLYQINNLPERFNTFLQTLTDKDQPLTEFQKTQYREISKSLENSAKLKLASNLQALVSAKDLAGPVGSAAKEFKATVVDPTIKSLGLDPNKNFYDPKASTKYLISENKPATSKIIDQAVTGAFTSPKNKARTDQILQLTGDAQNSAIENFAKDISNQLSTLGHGADVNGLKLKIKQYLQKNKKVK